MKKKIIRYSLFLFIIDLVSKLIIDNILKLNETINVINNFFSITKVYNTGASFSILMGFKYLFIIAAIIVMIIIFRYINSFKEALSNDLNTASAITLIHDLLKEETTDSTKVSIIKEFDTVLSLDLLNKKEVEVSEDLETYINEMIVKRNEAKKNRDFALADKIRDELKEKGILIKDTREGTTYEITK